MTPESSTFLPAMLFWAHILECSSAFLICDSRLMNAPSFSQLMPGKMESASRLLAFWLALQSLSTGYVLTSNDYGDSFV